MYRSEQGQARARMSAREAGLQTGNAMMRDNHYGGFEKIETGVYGLYPRQVPTPSACRRVVGRLD